MLLLFLLVFVITFIAAGVYSILYISAAAQERERQAHNANKSVDEHRKEIRNRVEESRARMEAARNRTRN